MPQINIPALSQSITAQWTEQDINLYNKLDFFLTTMQIKRRKSNVVWGRMTGSKPWQPNMGPTMRAVRKEPSPVQFQTALPNSIQDQPDVDIYGVNETINTAGLRHKHFESKVFYFLPSFQDFMKEHVQPTIEDITDKITRYNDFWLRTFIFYKSPRVMLPYRNLSEIVDAPVGVGTGTYKSAAWLQANLADIGNPGNLSFPALMRAVNVLENNLRVPFFSGGGQAADNAGYTGNKYVLIASGEWWNSLLDDNFILANKPLDLDIVFGPFKGSFGGRVTTMIEDMPLRLKADGTSVAPETIDADPASETYQETIPNPDYYDPTVSPYEVAWLCGGDGVGYRSLTVGPPPSEFTGGRMTAGKFKSLNWNGVVEITKDLLLQYPDGAGGFTYQPNKYGKYLQLISYVVMGCIDAQRRNVLPIIFKRKVSISG